MSQSAIILAAGLGQRMRPLTNTLPKPLIPIAGKSMLERAFDHVINEGISKIVVNTHYLASLIEKKAKELYPSTLISHEKILLETGGGIKQALPLLGDGAFFTLNGDSIWEGQQTLATMKNLWDEEKMDALLLLIPYERAYGYKGRGDFHMAMDGRLSRLNSSKKASYVYIGVQYTSPKLFQDAPCGAFSLNLLWDKALLRKRLYGHVHRGDWFHISTPEDLKMYEPMLLR